MYSENDAEEAKIRRIIESVKIPMVTTVKSNGKMRASPMYTMKVDTEGSIWFFTSKVTNKLMGLRTMRMFL